MNIVSSSSMTDVCSTWATLSDRGIYLNSICLICENEPQILVHCLFKYNPAKVISNLTVGNNFGLSEEDRSIFNHKIHN
jgi:hypothetical protein